MVTHFLALSHDLLDYLLTLLYLCLLHNMWVITQNQDQDTNKPNPLISYLFLCSSGQLSKTCIAITKEKDPKGPNAN